jgi:lipopolysaccharide biosynthesis glycosyltransferase
MKKNLLVTLADETYVEYAKQLFSSVYWNAGWCGDYMLLAYNIPEKKLKWFRNKGILIKKVKLLYNKKIYKWPPIIFSKFYLFTPEFKKWKNIVFLDADIIVRASLDGLTKVKGFAAVQDISPLKKQFRGDEILNKEVRRNLEKDYNLNEPSFNSGVIVINTEIIGENTFNRLMGLLGKYKDCDQSILNIYFYKKWIKLPRMYNFNPYTDKALYFGWKRDSKINAIVLHFYELRPWDKKNIFYKEWLSNLSRADSIDFKKIQRSRKYTKIEMQKNELILKKEGSRFKDGVYLLFLFVDRGLGVIGIFLRKCSPKLYFKLKEIWGKLRIK